MNYSISIFTSSLFIMIILISKKLYFIFIILKFCNPGLDVFVVRIPPKEKKFTLVITMPGHQKRKFSFDQKLLELTIKWIKIILNWKSFTERSGTFKKKIKTEAVVMYLKEREGQNPKSLVNRLLITNYQHYAVVLARSIRLTTARARSIWGHKIVNLYIICVHLYSQ